MQSPPNIVWISTHDINPHLGCYEGVWPGAEAAVTPNLDALAEQGVRFDQAFATSPVCAPSRSSIMTGCFPTAIGTMHMRSKAAPPPEVRLLPEYFREAGYYCTNNFFTDFQVVTPGTTFDDCSPTAHWRNRPDPEQPFFAAFHGMATHESKIHAEGEDFETLMAGVPTEDRHRPEDSQLPPYYPDTEVMREIWAKYLDLITAMDLWVGRIMAELEEDGLADNTIVVFWSDHGVGLPRAKRFAYEAGLREPLIIRWPGVLPAGEAREEPVYLMDLAPTMLTACGIDLPDHMHAQPLFDAAGSPGPKHDYIVGHRDRMDTAADRTRTVRDERFRYIRHSYPDRPLMQHIEYPDALGSWKELRHLHHQEAQLRGAGEDVQLMTPLQRSVVAPNKPAEELYDVQADPHETINLVNDPEFQPVLTRFRDALDSWLEEYPDLGEIPEDELIEQWRPGGHLQTTATPVVSEGPGGWAASCETEGVSIGWTQIPPGPIEPATSLGKATGDPVKDGRRWRAYTGPLTAQDLPAGTEEGTVYFKAWRLGYEPSEEVAVTIR